MRFNWAKITRQEMESSTIAQDDDEDWSESGWIACVIGNEAALGQYSHCSCYGTYTSLGEGSVGSSGEDLKFNWTGTKAQLIKLAKSGGDPDMPGRKANAEDYDYDHLMKVYEAIIAWEAK